MMTNNPTVSDLLSEANQLYTTVQQSQKEDKNINEALDVIEEIGESTEGLLKKESASPTYLQLMRVTLRRTLGFDLIDHLNIGLKHEDASNRYQNKIIFEAVRNVMIDFWFALKSVFNETWANYKTWFMTISAASQSLIKKANDIKAQADKLNGTPKLKSFEFKDYKHINFNGKLNSGQLRTGLAEFKLIVEQALNTRKVSEVERFIETANESLAKYIKGGEEAQADTSWIRRYSNLYLPTVDIDIQDLTDKEIKVKIGADENNATYKATTRTLPGNRLMVYSSIKSESTLPMDEQMGLINAFIFDNSDPQLTAQSIKVETLHPVQIADICKTVVELNDSIVFYDKAWQRRDAFMEKMMGLIDKTIESIDNDINGEAIELNYKKNTRAILDCIKRNNAYNASLLNMVVAISAGCLSYCQGSIAVFDGLDDEEKAQAEVEDNPLANL